MTLTAKSITILPGSSARGVGTAARVAYVSDLSAAGGDMTGIDGVAFVTVAGFGKEFAGGAALAKDVEVVEDCLVDTFS